MPQTLDHFEVLNFRKAGSGMVVLSKADLVDLEVPAFPWKSSGGRSP